MGKASLGAVLTNGDNLPRWSGTAVRTLNQTGCPPAPQQGCFNILNDTKRRSVDVRDDLGVS